ncbi:MAG: hypothetical protein FWD61_00670 [Phycisphaerales bacterium]|nr:hypothetical protein [Phycisphaerales bacterium]
MSQPVSPSSASASAYAAISWQATIRAVIAGVLIIAGILALHVLQTRWQLTFTKVPMPLPQQTLAVLSRHLAAGRYVAEGADQILDEAEVETLSTNDYLIRGYRDSQKNSGDPTRLLSLNMNYYGTGGATPHVPEICWAGVGMQEASNSRVTFDIPNVRRKDGSVVTLRARMISFVPPGETEDPKKLKNVAYLFNVNGHYVATAKEVISAFWKASNKYAFNTKIEVTVGGPGDFCSQQQAQEAIADFLRGTINHIEDVLPSPDSDPAQNSAGQAAAMDIAH